VRLLAAALLAVSAAPAAVDFTKEVAPVLVRTCLGCHGPDKSLGDLRVDSAAAIRKSVTAGNPDKSPLYLRTLLDPAKAGAMPPGGPPLARTETEALRQWILEGAVWPPGLTLAPAKKAPSNEMETVRRLRERIIAADQDAFESYRRNIPATDVAYEMVPIQGGEFVMGTPDSERGRRKDEGPQRNVRIEPFWMAKREVTWDEYRLFMFPKDPSDELVDAVSRPTRPYVEMSFGMGINGFPAISMTHHAANKYAQWLSARTGHFYRLPTEAEWEYACRAGSATAYSFGDDPSRLGDYAWFEGNSDGKYQKVGTKKPNAWGLHDMHGNVMEWTVDQYIPDFYAKSGTLEWAKSTRPYPHSARGGSWNDQETQCRCGARVGSDPSWKMQDPQLPKSIWYHTDAQWLGFRLVRPRVTPSAEQMDAFWNNGVANE